MTCMDCIYFDRCDISDNVYFATEELKKADCPDFKNKADFVEVVFCKDCEHWRRMGFDPILEKEFGHCHNNDFPFMCETRPDTDADDFCSYGKRK